jgi:hypothetical protein
MVLRAPAQLFTHTLKVTDLEKRRPDVLIALTQLSSHTLKGTDLEKRRPDVLIALTQLSSHTLKGTDLEKRRPDGVKSPGPAEASVSQPVQEDEGGRVLPARLQVIGGGR